MYGGAAMCRRGERAAVIVFGAWTVAECAFLLWLYLQPPARPWIAAATAMGLLLAAYVTARGVRNRMR